MVDLDQKQLYMERFPAPDTMQFSNLLQELEQYAKMGKYDQIQECIAKTFVRWEQEKLPQIWLEHATRRILNFISTQAGSEKSFIEREYQFEDAFYYSTNMEMLWQNLYMPFYHFPEKEKGNYKVDSPEFFGNIKTYLSDHISEPLSLQKISDQFAFSQTYMSRLFRKYTGQSYNQYLTGLRMERAKQLMEEHSGFFVKDIAEMVGYHDQFYFSRIFHSYTGQSPAVYLK